MLHVSVPSSAAALIALTFAVPLILYMYELEPKPPTQEIWKRKTCTVDKSSICTNESKNNYKIRKT